MCFCIKPTLLGIIIITLFGAGCASLPEDVERKPSYVLADTDETILGLVLQPHVDEHEEKSGFHLLRQGINAFAARLLLAGVAEKSLDLQYYIWHDDLTGRALHNRILDAADRGVRVRLLLDDLDTAGKDQMLHIIDAHPNIEVRLYNPFANRDRRARDFVSDLSRVDHRMHNKTLTADNQATILGGRNIGDEYFGASEEVGFSDLDVLAIGPVVKEVSSQFDLYWNSEWVYPLSAFEPDEAITEEQISAFRDKSNSYLEAAKNSSYGVAFQDLDIVNKSMAEHNFEWGDWQLMYDQPSKVIAEEVTAETHLAPNLKTAVFSAQQDLVIVSPYFVPGSRLTQNLVDMVGRGVRVRIMTNSLAANDVSIVHAGYKKYREPLVKGGVELYEFKPNSVVEANDKEDNNWIGSSRSSLHAKYLGYDLSHVFVGSFNIDARSVALNTEIGVLIESPVYAKLLSEKFDQLAIIKGYRLIIDDDGYLEWVTLENGEKIRFGNEPETSFWKRFGADFMLIFVPEKEL